MKHSLFYHIIKSTSYTLLTALLVCMSPAYFSFDLSYFMPCSIVSEGASDTIDLSQLETYKTAVESLSKEIVATVPVSDTEQQKLQYLALEQELDTLDDNIDNYEHIIRVAYKEGALSTEEYKSLKNQIGQLKNQIDLAEDILELKFGIDD